MTRDEMIEALIPALVNSGEALATKRRRLWRMSTVALQRELLLRGLVEYDDPPQVDEEGDADDRSSTYSMLGWSNAPLYAD